MNDIRAMGPYKVPEFMLGTMGVPRPEARPYGFQWAVNVSVVLEGQGDLMASAAQQGCLGVYHDVLSPANLVAVVQEEDVQ